MGYGVFMSKQKARTFVVNPYMSNQMEIKANSVVRVDSWYEFSTETGVVAFVPANVPVVEKDKLSG